MKLLRPVAIALALSTISYLASGKAKTIELQHSVVYKTQLNIRDYWVSEKLDGVRGYWDGQHLYTRSGNLINAPKWFSQYWPKHALDGELWAGRGEFEFASGCVRRKTNNDSCWQQMIFMVFDLPEHGGNFSERVQAMNTLQQSITDQSLDIVQQRQLRSNQALTTMLNTIIAAGGEGLMLHHQDANYQAGRNPQLMKLKRYQDAEAIVLAHLPGKGKYRGKLGALLVETPAGVQFKLGSGFTDQQRQQPPAIGSTVTYKYYGVTKNNIPRFASFLRIRITDLEQDDAESQQVQADQ